MVDRAQRVGSLTSSYYENCISAEELIERLVEAEGCIERALNFANDFGGIDGDHHKMWTIDQMVRQLTSKQYPNWLKKHCDGVDGPETYGWDEGIAP